MNNLVLSYMTLRKIIGILGASLAFLVAVGGVFSGTGLLGSMSSYYWTNSRDIFVGVLVMSGAFLMTYKGYDLKDNIITSLAGFFAIAIAIFPNKGPYEFASYFHLPIDVSNKLHFIAAIAFFLLITYMSYFQFTKGNNNKKRKALKNKIFRICAYVMLGNILFLVFLNVINAKEFVSNFKIIYFSELIMLLAFGISWMTKGQLILKDVEESENT